jgi:hypothetical protein
MNAMARLTLGLVDRALEPEDLASDEVLFKRGDAASFAELYERHLPGVYRYMASISCCPGSAMSSRRSCQCVSSPS